jgi:ubiquinone/menaquinone biosynthesis C-methylase UbiE
MIGSEIHQQVFRNTNQYYLQGAHVQANKHLVRFADRNAGARILDFGCATGVYCRALAERGFEVTGTDINDAYLAEARRTGVTTVGAAEAAGMPDGSFDTVLLFEVLEHVEDPAAIIGSAARLARKNVLVSVPHCGDTAALKACGLMYEHFNDEDHRNFFTADTLAAVLKPYGRTCTIVKGDPFLPHVLMAPSIRRRIVQAIGKAHLLPPYFYNRLYAVVSIA